MPTNSCTQNPAASEATACQTEAETRLYPSDQSSQAPNLAGLQEARDSAKPHLYAFQVQADTQGQETFSVDHEGTGKTASRSPLDRFCPLYLGQW